ncbi:MAG: hypothetical protein H6918_12995 [Sphingomonadaceae bacterium]|nr:hypothetical protein [Sphingomonadaceae bacterium]
MHQIAILLAPVALLLPSLGGEAELPAGSAELTPREGQVAGEAPGWQALEEARLPMVANQVRIEQRVVIRVTPRSPQVRQNLIADLPSREISTRFEERKIGKCLPVSSIAGVQAGQGSQLILFLRDRRIISANLEKACSARDYYSGFYVEKNGDGMFCVDRDKLQSRAGAKCEVSRMRQLVAVND